MELTQTYDTLLIKIFLKRETYERYKPYIRFGALARETKEILKAIGKYYSLDSAITEINLESFSTNFCQGLKNATDETIQLYKMIFNNILKLPEQDEQEIIRAFQEQATWEQLEEIKESKGFNLAMFRDILDQHEKFLPEATDKIWIDNDIDDLFSDESKEGLRWRLNFLNNHIGPLSKERFIVAAAYVNVGKTAFGISEAAYMIQQMTQGCVVWLNNEEGNKRLQRKFMCSILGRPWEKIQENKELAKQHYLERLNGDPDRFKIIDTREGFTMPKIRKVIEDLQPRLVVVDQIDKIATPNLQSYAEHDRLKKLYGEFRHIANEICPVLAISQTDASVTWVDRETEEPQYQRYITQRQLDGSKVGKQGEADFIVTIGMDPAYPNSRYLNLAKAKNEHTDAKAEVNFKASIFRYED